VLVLAFFSFFYFVSECSEGSIEELEWDFLAPYKARLLMRRYSLARMLSSGS
jgi:hypothetical protein